MATQAKPSDPIKGVNAGVIQVFSKLRSPDKSGLPKYRRVEQAILECIREGHWKAGDRLPAEEHLTGLAPFSLGTVQHAMRQLVEDGVIERRHGDGSYVKANMKLLSEPWHCRFLDVETGAILPISSQAIRRQAAGVGPWQVHFASSARIVRLDRIVSVNDEFLIFSRFYFDAGIVKILTKVPLKSLDGASFRKMVAENSSLPISRVQRQISFCDFDAETRQHLGPDAGMTGMSLEAIGSTGNRDAVFFHQFMIPKTDRPLVMPTSGSVED